MDTLEVSEKLVNEGFTNTQAKSLTRLLAEQELRLATKEDIQELKEDIQELKVDTQKNIQELRVDTKEEIKSLRNEVRWLFGMAAILAGLIIAGLKLI